MSCMQVLTFAWLEAVIINLNPWPLATYRKTIELSAVYSRIVSKEQQWLGQNAAAGDIESSGNRG